MNSNKIWHNPRCSKSREALALLQETQNQFEVVKYLDKSLTKEEITKVLTMLGFSSAREWMRTQESIYKELNLADEKSEERLIEAMIQHPKLIQRPVIIQGDKAIIARPLSSLTEFLQS